MVDSPLLKQTQGYVNGRWTGATGGARLAVTNPATGEKLADVPDMGAEETTAAVEAARIAMTDTPSLEERRSWLTAIADQLVANKQELGRIITLEQGKPLKEGVG